jgi:hypothetical protein
LNAHATGTNSIAIGNGAIATGSIAEGAGSSAGNAGVGLGDGTTATGTNSAALGVNANATFANSSAVGTGATTTRANQQVFGTLSNTYTAPGITSGASLAAQSGSPLIVTSDAGGNVATNTAAGLGLATTSQIAAINGQLVNLQSQIGELRFGIAAAAAAAYVPTPSGPGRTTFAVNGSLFDTTGGVGFAFAHRFANTSIPVYFSGAYGNGGGREHVGRVGFAWEW